MAEHTERWTLNRLIATCRDGERGFRYAENHVRDSTIKARSSWRSPSNATNSPPTSSRTPSALAEPMSRTGVWPARCTAAG